jgi:pimeloyl-ACP methyl ester carboxylesterase
VVAALDGPIEPIAVDRPGWDGSRAARDIPGNAVSALEILDAHGIDRATIVAHSFGAAIAAWIAVEHPERVGALVLLAPAVNVQSLQWIDWLLGGPFVGPALSAGAVAGPGHALRSAQVRGWVRSRFGLSDDYLAWIGGVLRRPSAWRTFLIEQRAMLSQLPELERRLSRIAAPTTIMIGSADRVVPAASAKVLAGQIADATLVPVRGAGHLLALQHAGRVAEVTLAAAATSQSARDRLQGA